VKSGVVSFSGVDIERRARREEERKVDSLLEDPQQQIRVRSSLMSFVDLQVLERKEISPRRRLHGREATNHDHAVLLKQRVEHRLPEQHSVREVLDLRTRRRLVFKPDRISDLLERGAVPGQFNRRGEGGGRKMVGADLVSQNGTHLFRHTSCHARRSYSSRLGTSHYTAICRPSRFVEILREFWEDESWREEERRR